MMFLLHGAYVHVSATFDNESSQHRQQRLAFRYNFQNSFNRLVTFQEPRSLRRRGNNCNISGVANVALPRHLNLES